MDAILNKVKSNGVVAIPLRLLKKIGVRPGAEIFVHLENDTLVLEKPHHSVKHLRGKFKNLEIEEPIRNLRKRWNTWERKTSA